MIYRNDKSKLSESNKIENSYLNTVIIAFCINILLFKHNCGHIVKRKTCNWMP